MAANFIELQEEVTDEKFTDPTQTQGTNPDAVEQTTAQPDEAVPELPEKYRGKALDEIIKMHQEAEKLIGRQAQEVGEVRKLADSLLKQQLESKHDTQPSKAQEIDWFEDPENPEGPKQWMTSGIAKQELVFVLWKAVQELTQKVKYLENKLGS